MKSRDARTGQVTKALQVIAWVVCVCFSVKIVLCSLGRRVSGVCVVGIKVRVGSWNSVCVPWPHPQRVLWRCPTLPHPPRCSTIGACGLSFQVRNGCWAFPRGYDHHKWFNQYSIVPQCVGVCVGCDPHSGDEQLCGACQPLCGFSAVCLWLNECLLVSAH